MKQKLKSTILIASLTMFAAMATGCVTPSVKPMPPIKLQPLPLEALPPDALKECVPTCLIGLALEQNNMLEELTSY